ncbi:MAG: phytoene/squalene synthase family protein [Cyclobacteriaceae bacterium]
MKEIFDNLSERTSKTTTKRYSTSFSLGIYFLDRSIHRHIYNIYGFVRFADEIVDTFLDYDRETLMLDFRNDTVKAIGQKISLNPILNAFQFTVNKYNIEWELIDTFLKSMEMDLEQSSHDNQSFDEYIVGSAEVVGLMCLRVFTNNDRNQYDHLKPSAMRLGAAFQKVNFLRDMKADYEVLGRCYFPNIDLSRFSSEQKRLIEEDIEEDFDKALEGIRQLPKNSRQGVYLAYIYYRALFKKIKGVSPDKIMSMRIRIPNRLKFSLMLNSVIRVRINQL